MLYFYNPFDAPANNEDTLLYGFGIDLGDINFVFFSGN